MDLLSFCVVTAGQLAREVYVNMRREASSLRIQRDFRMYIARKAYKDLCSSATCIQTGMRGMAARNELRFRRQTQAAIIIQVGYYFFFGDKISSCLFTYLFIVALKSVKCFLKLQCKFGILKI